MKHPVALALILLGVIALAPGALAPADKPLKTQGGLVTSADAVKIHYIEAGKGPAILFVPPAGRCRDESGRSKSLTLRRRIA
jgi:hypothetical protein